MPSRHARALPTLLAILMLSLLGFLTACGSDEEEAAATPEATAAAQPGAGKPPLTIGTKDFTEEFILGELYTQALEAKGYTVELKRNIGPTEITDRALRSGTIDAYPEYTGITVAVVAENDILAKSPEQTAQLAKEFYEGRGQAVSDPTPFEDKDALAVTKAYAQENSLASVADLTKLDSFKLGARPEFRNRFTGLKGMRQVYDIDNAEFEQLALGLQYGALDSGDVDVANVFSTDAQLASGKYQLLEDPEGVFGFQNIFFVIDAEKLQQLGGASFMDVINSVNRLLTDKAMQTMNSAVDIDKREAREVAAAFLAANQLA